MNKQAKGAKFQKWFFDLVEFLEKSHNPGVWTHWSVSEYTLVEVRDSPRPQECCNASPAPWVGNTAPEARRNRSCWFHAARFLATVPEDSEESAGGHGDFIHEHLIDDIFQKSLANLLILLLSVTGADRIVSGPLELRGSATRRTRLDRKVECTIQNGVMTFYEPAETGTEAVVLAREQVSGIIVTIVLAQTRKFSICNPEDIDSTQVWCCAKDQVNRNKWLAVLHRLGVDLYCEDDDGQIRRMRQGVQAQPGRTDL